MSYYLQAAVFIAKKESFTQTASWDVNAYRLGYGSDTITFNDGTYRTVRVGDSTTVANAQKDLARRIKQFEEKIITYLYNKNGITRQQWNDLPDPAKAGLISFAYNYGNIVKNSIREAIKTGDVDKIADAVVSSTVNDMKGTIYYNGLRKRRKEEAAMIRSEKSKPKKDKTFVKNTMVIAIILVSAYVLVKLYKKDAIPF